MAVAMARACELGATEFALPSAGNAGGAAAAYGAYWKVPVHVALPGDTPDSFRLEVRLHGGRSYDVDGDIAQAGPGELGANYTLLLDGGWNTTEIMLEAGDAIETTVSRIPYLNNFPG